MDAVTAIRSHLPPTPSPSRPAPDRLISAPAAQTCPPIAATLQSVAVRQPAVAAGIAAARLAERQEGDTPATEARAAADAARDAYIRASIAAGVSPLPLP